MDNNLHKVFTGTEVEVWLLKGQLEENGISAMIRDEFASGLGAGFYGGSPSSLELLVNGPDMERAAPVIREFVESRDSGRA